MKIKHKILFLLSFVVLQGFSQKIKVKKGEIFVDKEKIGQMEKIKVKPRVYVYKITDNNGEHVFNFRTEYAPSLLANGSNKYLYYTIESVKDEKRASVQNKKFYPSKKRIAKYLVNSNLLTKDGVNKDAILEYILNKDSLPNKIQKKIKAEQELISFAKFKIDRNTEDPIYVFFDKTTVGKSVLNGRRVLKPRYNIYQGIKDLKTNEFVSKTFIGYAIAESVMSNDNTPGASVNAPKNYRPHPESSYELIIYNTKNVPIASHTSFRYITYYPFEEFKLLSEKAREIKKIKNVKKRIGYITRDLIDKKIL